MTATTTTRRRVALALTAAVALSACGGGQTESADGRTQITSGLSTTESTLGQSYYSALPEYLGYWADAGLDVQQSRFNGSGETITAVATGRIDIAHAGNFSNMAAHVNGGAQTTSFMHDINGNPYFPLVLADSPIQTLEDLEGTTLGVFSVASDANELLQGVMEEQGLDANSVNIVATGIGATAAEALRTGQIDGWMAYDSGAALLTTLGLDWRAVEPELFDDYGPGSGIVVQPQLLDDEREALVAYGRGIAQAMVFTRANPEAAVLIHWEVFPETRPAGVPQEEALADGVAELQARMDNVVAVDDLEGTVSDERFQGYIDVFAAAGVIDGDLELADIWTDELIADINDFDRAAIEQQARDFDVDALG